VVLPLKTKGYFQTPGWKRSPVRGTCPSSIGKGSLCLSAIFSGDKVTRRLLGKARFWLVIVSPLAVAVVLFVEIKPPIFRLSLEDLKPALAMSLRALSLILAVQRAGLARLHRMHGLWEDAI